VRQQRFTSTVQKQRQIHLNLFHQVVSKSLTHTETAADGFLNWVRSSFGNAPSETNAREWTNFFEGNIGMFLRNAVLHTTGSIGYYKVKKAIPGNPIEIGEKLLNLRTRTTPVEDNRNIVGNSAEDLPEDVQIYGWLEPEIGISDGSKYWLLVATNNSKIVWVASNAVSYMENDLISYTQLDPFKVSPDRNYDNSDDADLRAILGELP
jgi:hypothetical protein